MSKEKLIHSRPAVLSEWHIVSGVENLLPMQPELAVLASCCEQQGVLDFLDYFLQVPNSGFGVLFSSVSNAKWTESFTRGSRYPHLLFRTGPDGLEAAVLLLEYRVLGLRTGLYIPFDLDGYRTVIAPPEQRNLVARQAAEYLLKRGARLLLISYMETQPGSAVRASDHVPERSDPIASQVRTASRMLPLHSTFDQTLSTMGSHTRRNLRLAQRRLRKEMGAVLVPEAELTLAEFLHLNRNSKYAVPNDVAAWRFHTARTMRGGVFAGLRADDGRWLSVLGAHCSEQTVCLDWQMNLTGYASLSIGNAMRAFFIQHQIQRGMRWIRFEGGTPHSISSAFVVEHSRELLFARSRWLVRFLRSVFKRVPARGLLAKALTFETFAS